MALLPHFPIFALSDGNKGKQNFPKINISFKILYIYAYPFILFELKDDEFSRLLPFPQFYFRQFFLVL